ncbi:MAG: hypothetical protein V2I43_15145 [Parvularcula sp.]|nr:hypothetical protein [Parvularcula sp.]
MSPETLHQLNKANAEIARLTQELERVKAEKEALKSKMPVFADTGEPALPSVALKDGGYVGESLAYCVDSECKIRTVVVESMRPRIVGGVDHSSQADWSRVYSTSFAASLAAAKEGGRG